MQGEKTWLPALTGSRYIKTKKRKELAMKVRIILIVCAMSALLYGSSILPLQAACFQWGSATCLRCGAVATLDLGGGNTTNAHVIQDATFWSNTNGTYCVVDGPTATNCYYIAAYVNPSTHTCTCGIGVVSFWVNKLVASAGGVCPAGGGGTCNQPGITIGCPPASEWTCTCP